MRNKLYVSNVYTYDELIKSLNLNQSKIGETYDRISALSTNYNAFFDFSSLSDSDKVSFNEVLSLIYDLNKEASFFISYEDEINNISLIERIKLFGEVYINLKRYSPRYLKMLELYRSQEDNLLDKIKTTNGRVLKLNNTPQERDSNDVYADMPYVNNSSKEIGESATDGNTLMARLNEIQNSYRNLLDEWASEVASLFHIDE